MEKQLISVFGNSFDEQDIVNLKAVLDSHLLGMGKITTQFEQAFAAKIGMPFAAATNSCTNAFWLLFKALNLPEHSEIIIPNIHFFGIKNILQLFNLQIVVTDVSEDIPNINLNNIKNKITSNTKVIIFLEHSGYPVTDIVKIKSYLQEIGRNDILLVLDAANSPFTKLFGEFSAKNYDIALYSFDFNKILVTGDGGMAVSHREDLIKEIKSLSYYGIQDSAKSGFEKSQSGKIWWEVDIAKPCMKLAMNNLVASLGLSQLTKIEKFLDKRSFIRNLYLDKLRSVSSIGLPPQDPNITNNLYLFWIKLINKETRDKLAHFLLQQGIYTTVKYQPLDVLADTPNSFDYYNRSLCLPFNQNLTEAQVSFIVEKIGVFSEL